MSATFSEPIIRLSKMRFEEPASLMMEVDLDDAPQSSEFQPELPLIAHSDLSLPLVREPSPVLFMMESLERHSSARRTAG